MINLRFLFCSIGAGVWRQVSETCMNDSRVDYVTFTIAVRVSLLAKQEPLESKQPHKEIGVSLGFRG